MEVVEREKKLAAARKKLNEYKLNKSTVKGSTVTASAKPADVPAFYQNLNTQATTFNIFNPSAAAADNSNPYFVPTLNSEAPVLGFGSGDFTNTHAQSNVDLLANQNACQPLPPEENWGSQSVTDTINPFAVPLTVSQPNVSPTLGFDLSGFADVDNTPSIPTSPLFQPTVEVEPQCASTGQDLIGGNNTEQCSSVDNYYSTELNLASSIPVTSEYQPSAPMIINENLKNDGTDLHSTFENNACETVQSIDVKPEFDNTNTMFFEKTTSTPNEEIALHCYASSLFNSGGSAEPNVFKIGEHQQEVLEPLSVPVFGSNSTEADTSDKDSSTPINLFNVHVQEMPLAASHTQTLPGSQHIQIPNIVPDYNERNIETFHDSDASAKMDGLLPSLEPNIILEYNDRPTKPVKNIEETYVEAANDALIMDTQSNRIDNSTETYQHLKSVQDALELQIEELRRENTYLVNRHTELNSKLEESERLAHEFKLDRDRIKEESITTSQALRARINSLCEENQRIVKNSTEVGVDQRAKLEEKTRQLEEMQKAVIIVSQSKMEFAGRLDHELERVKELQSAIKIKDEEIFSIRTANGTLEEKLKQEQQKEAVIQQLQDQSRHYQVHCETLQKELVDMKKKLKTEEISSHNISTNHENLDNPDEEQEPYMEDLINELTQPPIFPWTKNDDGDIHEHDHADSTQQCDLEQDDHGSPGQQDEHHHASSSPQDDHHHGHSHDHNDDHHHGHSHSHHNDNHGHSHSHHDEHSPADSESNLGVVARRGPSDEVVEIKKTLHRLEWENSSFRNEIDILAVDAKQKLTYEGKCAALEEENQRLKLEVQDLEHVIVQLQGENDTIADYITLYQTQKLALKECAKEKDAQLEFLANEREMLLHRLAELTALVQDLKDTKSEAGSTCADDHSHACDHVPTLPGNSKRQIEGKIRDLLTEIGSSSLIENFHPCAVCSGRLMTV